MSKAEKSKSEGVKRASFVGRIKLSYVFIGLLLLVLGAGAYFGYQEYNNLKKENQKLSDPQEAARQETERIKRQVAMLIDVPKDEDPTIASVVDTSKLSDQAFFKNAQNGDKVLMYAQAKKAILYRPSTNKIIEVAPINIGTDQNSNKPKSTEGTKPDN